MQQTINWQLRFCEFKFKRNALPDGCPEKSVEDINLDNTHCQANDLNQTSE